MKKIAVAALAPLTSAACDDAMMGNFGQTEINRIDSDLEGNLTEAGIEAAQANGEL